MKLEYPRKLRRTETCKRLTHFTVVIKGELTQAVNMFISPVKLDKFNMGVYGVGSLLETLEVQFLQFSPT